jgi:hypothetical protein
MQLRSANRPSGSEPQARPCLPSVEKLDQRVLLSASPSAIYLKYGSVPQTVTALIGDGIKLTESEFAALGTISLEGESSDDKHKGEIQLLSDEFMKINKIFEDYGEQILELKILPQPTGTSAASPQDIPITKPTDVSSALAAEFVKINVLATDLNDSSDGLLLPAVQDIQKVALGDGSVFNGGFFGDLTGLLNSGLVSQIPSDDLMGYVKIGREFIKLDQALMDFKVDVIMGAPLDDQMNIALDKVNREFIKIKMEDVVISGVNQVPPDFLDGLQAEIDTLITGQSTGGGT